MDIEVKIDENYTTPKIIIYTNKVTNEISTLMNSFTSNDQPLKVYNDNKLYILNQNEIESIYSEKGIVYVRHNNQVYTTKSRLYELEEQLNKKIFLRISNSEIINFDMVENIDFKIIGTLLINFKSGNKTYSSRRYIQKIKEFLEL